jgi:uncharacterized protein with beta-barrel porin domain
MLIEKLKHNNTKLRFYASWRKALRDSTLTLSALLAEGRSFEVSEKQAKGIEKSLAAIKIDEKLPTEIDDSVNMSFNINNANNRRTLVGKQ